MAMLFALVAAMFISIVPVKAEAAASCTKHTATEWQKDEYKHWQVCKTCGDVTKVQTSHDDLVYAKKDAATHTVKCRTCGYTADVAHVPVADGTNCRCAKCGVLIDHTLSWSTTGGTHKQICDVCNYETAAADHSWTVVDNENGKHTKTCSVCEKVITEAHTDSSEDKDCVCDACGVPVETNHSPVEVAGKAATCTEPGISGHLKCQYCGKLFSKSIPGKVLTEADVVVKALDHKAKTAWEVTEDGKHYHECANTGCEEKLDLAAHVPGTYAHDASKHWAVCSVCGCWLDKVDHEWTYTQIDGTDTHKVKCSVCQIGESTKECKNEDNDCFCDDCGGLMNHNKGDMKYLCYAPTCTESGWYENWLCEKCGTRFNKDYDVIEEASVFRAALGHKAKKAISCNETEHYNLCENAGCEEKLNVEAHKMVMKPNGADTHYTVCEVCNKMPDALKFVKHEDADKDCVCDGCGYEKVHARSDMTYHSSIKATCTTEGRVGHFSCNTCGKLFEGSNAAGFTPFTKSTVRKALGHDLSVVGITAGGLHQLKCTRCDAYVAKNHYSEDGDCVCDVAGCEVPAHSHRFIQVLGKAPTCTEAGYEAYNKYEGCGRMFDLNQTEITAPVVIPATGHDTAAAWTPGENGMHVKVCGDCGEIIASEAHKYVNRSITCSVCGAEEGLTHVAAKAATCGEAGNIEYWYSKITGKMYADAAGTQPVTSIAVAATGHKMSGWEDLGNGQGHKQVCLNNCGHTLTENHDNANSCFCTECGGFKNGHTNELVEAVPATCAKAGTQAHFKCSCGKLYDLGYNPIEKAGSIAQLKHVMNTEVKKDAKLGKHYIECKNCDYKMYEEHAMVMSDPNKGNYHQRLCECGELEIETHYDKNGDNKCDVCDHSMNGSSSVKVEQHDNKTVYTGQSETVKPTKNWWWNWQESFTPSNSGGTTATTEKTTESGTTSGNTATGNTGSTATQAPAAGNNGGTTSNGSTSNSGSTTVTAPSASQTNVLIQFVNWFLGLFGF